MGSKPEINHGSDVAEDIGRMFLNESLSDVVFVVEGKRIFAHKVVLAARSQIFRDMLFGQTPLTTCKREIYINDCSALSFKNFIKYVYSGKISLIGTDETESQELLAMALKYQMTQLAQTILDIDLMTVQEMSSVKPNPKPKEEPIKEAIKTPNVNLLRFEDIANVNNGAVVAEGINPERLFSSKKDLDEKSLTKHKIEINTKGILIKLNIPVVINLVKFRLLDIEPKRYYCYYVQISPDGNNWQTVADYRYYSCRSWQTIFFDQKLTKMIRILGTHSNEKTFFTNTRYFTIISFFCGLTQGLPKMWNGFWEPECNIASSGRGAAVVINNGNDYCRNAKMINDSIEFEYKKYNHIFSEFNFDRDSQLIIHLPQPVATSSLSFYICGEDKFKYTVKVTTDPIDKEIKNWILVSDKRKQFNAPKWQRITFNKTKVVLICISNIRCLDESVNTLPILSFNCP